VLELREVFEMVTKQTEPDLDAWREQEQRHRRASRNRKLGALAVAAGIGLVAVIVVIRAAGDGTGTQPAVQPDPVAVPEVDYMLDLETGEITPLPESIAGEGEFDSYAVSPDGQMLAYAATGNDGNTQVFVADLDGTGIRQVTHEARGASMADWSPDGTKIVYVEGDVGDGLSANVFVLDLATETATQVTNESSGLWAPNFSPDGSSIVYGAPDRSGRWGIRIVPATGGRSRLLVGAGRVQPVGDSDLSPDGSQLAFLAEGSQEGTDIWIADADGSGLRPVARGQGEGLWGPRWSPDGTRLVYFREDSSPDVFVLDVTTGESQRVADGTVATWLDDHTLIVDNGL
jgi:Tol biopolymer transport system component